MAATSTTTDDLSDIKIKLLVKSLESLKGDGTSMISLLIPPKGQIAKVNQMLTDEFGTATNIKSRVNRQSVLTAITAAQQKLKLYKNIPDNGLALYCGQAIGVDGKERKIAIGFEPPKQLTTNLYLCDDRFHTEALMEMTHKTQTFGFIIVDGSGVLFATLCGNVRTRLLAYEVDLPKKHNKGGQSSVRFARLRKEARHNYVTKLAEQTNRLFLGDDKVSVDGLIIAGSADLKNELATCDLLDPRLKGIIIALIDISYGGNDGFNQAVQASAAILANVRYVEEQKILAEFFTQINRDTNKYVYGKTDTLSLLRQGAIERLIVWEDYKENDASNDIDDLLEWLVYNVEGQYGTKVIVVSDSTPEGSQFVKGFGGLGGLLRYAITQVVDVDGASVADTDDFFI